jgi:hypothetical protein
MILSSLFKQRELLARDIHRRPFEFNILGYDPENQIHKELAKLDAEVAEVANNSKSSYTLQEIHALSEQMVGALKEAEK